MTEIRFWLSESRIIQLTVFMVKCALDIVHSSIGHAAAFKDVEPFFCGLLLRDLLNHTIDFESVFHSGTICYKSIVRLPLGTL